MELNTNNNITNKNTNYDDSNKFLNELSLDYRNCSLTNKYMKLYRDNFIKKDEFNFKISTVFSIDQTNEDLFK
jgi:hypothetical protein